ncbi:site-specific DNA-methyltransferase [Actinokineospora sp. NBRC 105648]|uniref:DNA-methyltransferase n=1 Tax=Actinokineospora sp. NBRC 105648 TaxID=3032206 RepID=UPI0024A47B0B|nr:site-specific DNA-methyltransferase [Actinokineospora sp. NBRC 105648]GLZ37850.1 methyltransferase [Actinokineospora sp. NBRC 105648]
MTSIPFWDSDGVTLHCGDATDVLSAMPDSSVHCVVTSPPYYGLRDYGTGRWVGGARDCEHSKVRHAAAETDDPALQHRRCERCGALREDRQHGLEATPQDYINRLRDVFAQLHRVLVPDGTVWLNLGDSYSAQPPGRTRDPMANSTLHGAAAATTLRDSVRAAAVDRTRALPPKNLLGMPWRTAFALQADGWILRNAIIWHKPNAMPESVQDRLSNRYETIFLLTRQRKYYFDLDAIREPLARPEAIGQHIVIGGNNKGRHAGIDATARRRGHTATGRYGANRTAMPRWRGDSLAPTGRQHDARHPSGKNPGDVWSMSTRPLREAHFAAFPIDIPLRCIAAGCPPQGVVLDPFSGAATTGMAARRLGREYVGIDLNPEYHRIGIRRLRLDSGSNGDARAAA